MTKKDFIKDCDFHVYTGSRQKYNVIYFDYKVIRDENAEPDELMGKPIIARGFKFGVALDIKNGTKAELIKHAYNWIIKGIELPWYVRYKLAENDAKRFKVPLSLNW